MTTSAERLADAIFDLVDKSHPRGLIRSELVDLITRHYGNEPLEKELSHAEKVRRAVEMQKVANDFFLYGNGIVCVDDAGNLQHVPPSEANGYIATQSSNPTPKPDFSNLLFWTKSGDTTIVHQWNEDLGDEALKDLSKPEEPVTNEAWIDMTSKVVRRNGFEFVADLPPGFADGRAKVGDVFGKIFITHPDWPPMEWMSYGKYWSTVTPGEKS